MVDNDVHGCLLCAELIGDVLHFKSPVLVLFELSPFLEYPRDFTLYNRALDQAVKALIMNSMIAKKDLLQKSRKKPTGCRNVRTPTTPMQKS